MRTSLLIRHHFGVLNRNINNVKAFLAQRSRTLEAQEARKAPIGVPKDLPAPSAVVKGKGGKKPEADGKGKSKGAAKGAAPCMARGATARKQFSEEYS